MDKRHIIEKLFAKGKELGMQDMEVYLEGNKELDMMVFDGELDKYSISKEEGLSFRGIYKGKMGYSYTEKIDETSIEMLVKEAIENAQLIDSDDEELIFEGSKEYKEVSTFNDELDRITPDIEIDFIKVLEKAAFKADRRVESVNYCSYGKNSSETIIVNTKGLDLRNKINMAHGYISVMVKDGEDVKTAEKYIVTNKFDKLDPNNLAEDTVSEAVSLFGADSIESGSYTVVLRNNVAADILAAFAPVFSAENVQKNLSLLKDKIGNEIASSIVTIIDDPFLENGAYTRPFDGEGVATRYKKVIDKGVLKTYLHNLKTAKKDGVESTGNGYKSSYKSSVGISPTNMYIEQGNSTFDDIIRGIDKGILIIDVQGLHSGLNAVSGDFSLSAYGYEIINGKINRPVNQITIAGNLYEMLKDIEVIGNDLKFGLPAYGYIGSPSLKIKKLSVAGK